MADYKLKLDFDPDTERRLTDYILQDIATGRFRLSQDHVFVLDPHGSDPGRGDLARTIKEKLPFIDFDSGGIKVLDLKLRGADVRFSIVPRIDLPHGGKGIGGTIGLRFTILNW